MTTIFKLKLSLIGDRVKNVFSETSPIEIVGERSKGAGARRPFKSLPSETSPYSNGPGIVSINITTTSDDDDLPKYSLYEVLSHDVASDCWVIVYDRVYDLTNFLGSHPGGDDIILEYAGRDATLAFRSVGHSKFAENALQPYLIGILEEKDRLWMYQGDFRRGSR